MNSIMKISLVVSISLSLLCQLAWSQNRIIGGSEIAIARVPYMLRLMVRKSPTTSGLCGASIIGPEWGLTAAHCLEARPNPNAVRVIAGTADVRNLASTAETRQVVQYSIHERYTKASNGYDIAVFKVTPRFIYSEVVKPVRLPQSGQNLNDGTALIAGWGHTSPGGTSQTKLRAVTVPKINTNTCRQKYARGGITLHNGEICYGYHRGTTTRDKCQGDSGGPLVADSVVIGLVSRGVECGTKGYPGIYTQVLFYRGWIRGKTGI